MSEADLVLSGVGVTLGRRRVVQDVSLELSGGSLVAIVGPNGAGKSSLLRAILDLIPHAGSIMLAGQDLGTIAARERARRVAYLPQGHEAHWPLPARDIVALGRTPHGAADPARLGETDAAAILAAMSLTETTALADRPVTALSGGERARVALARVFAVGASVILADEPTAALDPRHQLDVMKALRAKADAGALVVAVTHDLGLAARFAHQIAVLSEGKLMAFGPPHAALTPDLLAQVFGIQVFSTEHQGQSVVVPWS